MYSLIQEGKSNVKFIFLAIVAAVCAMAVIFFGNSQSNKEFVAVSDDGVVLLSSRHPQINSVNAIPNADNLPENGNSTWQEYKNDILGISFQYPSEWGRPQTIPYPYLTDLKALSGKNASYDDSLGIEFIDPITFERKGPVINIYNGQYQGRLFPNGLAIRFGAMDNFTQLRQNGNICDYRIAFNKRPAYQGLAEELSEECVSGVKTHFYRITQADNQSVSDWNDYYLSKIAFLKLENGYYDNVLIEENIWFGQAKSDNLAMRDIFVGTNIPEVKNPIDRETYFKKGEEFAAFVGSVKKIKPISSEIPVLAKFTGESQPITTIRQYYYEISRGNLKNAYAMYSDAKINYEEYEKWYKDVLIAAPVDFEMIDIGKYRFNVRYQDKNAASETYRVVMLVKNGKIIPISSEKILDNKTTYKNLSAFTAERLGKSYLILSDNSKERIIDEGTTDLLAGTVMSGDRITFSPEGNYLAAGVFGWEWYGVNVYDVKKGKKIRQLSMPSSFGFAPGDKYFFACAAAGFSGDYYAVVEKFPGSETSYYSCLNNDDIGYDKIDCQYDSSTRSIVFTASDLYDIETAASLPGKKIVRFSIDTGKAVETIDSGD